MEKKSKFQWTNVAASVVGSIGAMTIGYFADEIMEALKASNLKSKSKEYYEEMIKAHPALKKEDPQIVARYWASLFHFSPHMAADPLSSGAFIRQSIDRGFPELYGGPPIDTYNTLSGIQKAVTDANKPNRRFSEVAQAAAGNVMGMGLQDISGYVKPSDKYPFPAPKGQIRRDRNPVRTDRNLVRTDRNPEKK